jgi:hypothetical protein
VHRLGHWKHRVHRPALAFAEPETQGRHRFLPQRGAAFLASVAGAVHMGSRAKHNLLTMQACECRYPEPGLHRDQS